MQLTKHKKYIIATEIHLSDIENILNETTETDEPQISFPQANSMERIINLIELLYEKPMLKQEITDTYDFDERQTNYYNDAGRYLELIDKSRTDNHIQFSLSPKGEKIMGFEYKNRLLYIAKQILIHKAFRETLKLHLKHGEMPDKNTIIKIMKNSNLHHITSEETYLRRSSTITSWINWILSIIDE